MVKDFIEKIPRKHDPNEIRQIRFVWMDSKNEKEINQKQRSMQKEISDTSLDNLVIAIKWFFKKPERLTAFSRKIAEFEKLHPPRREIDNSRSRTYSPLNALSNNASKAAINNNRRANSTH